MIVGLLPASVLAATPGDMVVISEKEYAVAPDITEYELITNNSDLSAQQAGHIMEVELGGYADIIVGYNDYNIPAIQSGNNWGMEEPTAQAQNAETRRDVNVVGAVNGDFFNTSNGLMWRVQYSVRGDAYRFEEPISSSMDVLQTVSEKSKEQGESPRFYPGRFTLHSTQNMHNFLLLDQQSGLVWQVQYPRDSENIILISR